MNQNRKLLVDRLKGYGVCNECVHRAKHNCPGYPCRLIEDIKSAADLLKTDDAPIKPLTLEELIALNDEGNCNNEYNPIFVETKKMAYGVKNGSWIIAGPRSIRTDMRFKPMRYFVDAHIVNLDSTEYGQTWRCWPSKPSAEERAATPWREAEHERQP